MNIFVKFFTSLLAGIVLMDLPCPLFAGVQSQTLHCLAPSTALRGTIYADIGAYFNSLSNASFAGRESYEKVTQDSDFQQYETAPAQKIYSILNKTAVVPALGVGGILAAQLASFGWDSVFQKEPSDEERAMLKQKAESDLKNLFETAKLKNDLTLLRALTYVQNIEVTTNTALVGSHGKDIETGTVYLTPSMIQGGMTRYLLFRRAFGLKFSNEIILRTGRSDSIGESFWTRYFGYQFFKRRDLLNWSIKEKSQAFPSGFLEAFARNKDRKILSGEYRHYAYSDPLKSVVFRLLVKARNGENVSRLQYWDFFERIQGPEGEEYDEERVFVGLYESIRNAFSDLLEESIREEGLPSGAYATAWDALVTKRGIDFNKSYLLVAERLNLLPSYVDTIPSPSTAEMATSA